MVTEYVLPAFASVGVKQNVPVAEPATLELTTNVAGGMIPLVAVKVIMLLLASVAETGVQYN